MIGFLARRLLLSITVVISVSIIAFVLLRLSGDIAQTLAGPTASVEDVERLRAAHGLDRPLVIQYLHWAAGVLSGDLGTSLFARQPVWDMVISRLPVTLTLGGMALCLALALGIPLGILAATFQNTVIDRAALTVAVIGQSMPAFWFGLVLILIFGVKLRWLPISGSATWWHFLLPAIALGYYALPAIMRLTRAGMLEVIRADYIRTARAKGLAPAQVVFGHALPNAILPVVSVAAVQLGFMLGGSIIIESVFSLNGIGYLAYTSILRADFPVVQAIVLVVSLLYVLLIFLSDLINASIDPRLRLS